MHATRAAVFLIMFLCVMPCGIHAMEKKSTECVNSIINRMPSEIHFVILNYIITDKSSDKKTVIKAIRSYARASKKYHHVVNGEEITKKLITAVALRFYYGNTFMSTIELRTSGAGGLLRKNGRLKEIASHFVGACGEGDYPKVSFMLAHKPEIINELDDDRGGVSGLMRAANKGHLRIVKKLLENYADINLKNSEGYTALTYAVTSSNVSPPGRNNWALIQLLLDEGADAFVKDKMGRNVLWYADDYYMRVRLREYLRLEEVPFYGCYLQ